MERYAFKMKLKPGCEEEYKKRHDEIWPELKQVISEAGIYDYSIFLDEETLTLFACHKVREDNTVDSLAENPVVRKWWDYMAELMDTHPDNAPVQIPLREVFHME
jgi:L-rhamnose mutarotase